MKRTFGVVLSVLILLLAGTAGTQKPQPRAHLHPAYYDTAPNSDDQQCDPSVQGCPQIPPPCPPCH
jgi:hypothetical protein